MLTAPRMVRTERAVRPCLPITLPTSWRRDAEFEDSIFFAVDGFHFDGRRLIDQGPRDFADQFVYLHHIDLGHDLAPDHSAFGNWRL